MAIKALNIYEEERYISTLEEDKSNPTVFVIGHLDSFLKAKIKDDLMRWRQSDGGALDNAEVTFQMYQCNIDAVRFGLKSIENLIDHEGKPVKFSTVSLSRFGQNYNVVAESILKVLPEKIIEELAARIMDRCELSSEEKKK